MSKAEEHNIITRMGWSIKACKLPDSYLEKIQIDRNVTIAEITDGKIIAVISNLHFAEKSSVNWDNVKNI